MLIEMTSPLNFFKHFIFLFRVNATADPTQMKNCMRKLSRKLADYDKGLLDTRTMDFYLYKRNKTEVMNLFDFFPANFGISVSDDEGKIRVLDLVSFGMYMRDDTGADLASPLK